jgi:hypothetical protein
VVGRLPFKGSQATPSWCGLSSYCQLRDFSSCTIAQADNGCNEVGLRTGMLAGACAGFSQRPQARGYPREFSWNQDEPWHGFEGAPREKQADEDVMILEENGA